MQEKQQLIETTPEEAKTLDSFGKHFVSAIINIFK